MVWPSERALKQRGVLIKTQRGRSLRHLQFTKEFLLNSLTRLGLLFEFKCGNSFMSAQKKLNVKTIHYFIWITTNTCHNIQHNSLPLQVCLGRTDEIVNTYSRLANVYHIYVCMYEWIWCSYWKKKKFHKCIPDNIQVRATSGRRL